MSREMVDKRNKLHLTSFSTIRWIAKPNYQISCSYHFKWRVRAWAGGVNITLIKCLPHGRDIGVGESKIFTPNRLGISFFGSVTIWTITQSPMTLAIVYFLFLWGKEFIWQSEFEYNMGDYKVNTDHKYLPKNYSRMSYSEFFHLN